MKNPPVLAVALLRKLLSDRDRNTILGDLLEEFHERGGDANLWYLRQVLGFLTLARLTRQVPLRVAFAFAVGLAEYAIFWVLPTLAGVQPEWGAFSVVSTVLCSFSALAIVREPDAAMAVKFVGIISVSWFLLFAGVVAWIFHRPEFSPIPAVPTFLVCVVGASLQASAMRGRVALGVFAAVTTGLLAAGLAGVILRATGVPHPPLQTLPFLPGVAAFMGAIGGLFGSRFGRRQNQFSLSELHIGA